MGLLDGILTDAVESVLETLDTVATWTRQPVASYNAETDSETAGTPTSDSIFISPPDKYSKKDIDGINVLIDDMKITTSNAKAPANGYSKETDKITIGSQVFRIITVTPIYSGDEVCAYELQLRK